MPFAGPPLRLTRDHYRRILAHCYDGLPDEACGLLAGPPGGPIEEVYPCRNADASARTYTIDSRDHIRALRDAEARGLELVGGFHSHTHTEAYPSETDVRQAIDPSWAYVIVSLRDGEPVLRAFRIVDARVGELPVELLA